MNARTTTLLLFLLFLFFFFFLFFFLFSCASDNEHCPARVRPRPHRTQHAADTKAGGVCVEVLYRGL